MDERRIRIRIRFARGLDVMVVLNHVLVADFLEGGHRFRGVEGTLIDRHLGELEPVAKDIAEVHIEDFLARAEVPDHVVEFLARIHQHLGNRSDAEVEPVIRAFLDRHKLLQAFNRGKHRVHTLIAFGRSGGVVRVACHTNLVLGCDWNDPLEKIGDAFPVGVFAH